MTTEIAVIIGTFIVGVFGYLTATSVREKTLRAEERQKRTEQVRLKGTAAGEAVLEAMADLLIAVESLQVHFNATGTTALNLQQTKQWFAPVAAPASRMLKTIYATSMYTTPAIRDGVRTLLAPVFAGGVDFSQWAQFATDLHAQHSRITAEFHDAYLKGRLEL